jgi:hypothetical protein
MNALTMSSREVKAPAGCPRRAGLVLMALPVLFLLWVAAHEQSDAEVVAKASTEVGWLGATSGSSGGPSRCASREGGVGGDEWNDRRRLADPACAATLPAGLEEVRVVLLIERVLQIAATSLSVPAAPAVREDL